jgi:imidazolonepropionase
MSDLLITGVGSLVTNLPGSDLLGTIPDSAVAVRGGRVVWAGPDAELPGEHRDLPVLDAGGRAAIPGFVDAHTHLVFAGERGDEFVMRLRGAGYDEVLAAGGGIHATVAATREATSAQLVTDAIARAQRMLSTGTTTVEIKSGYGLDTATERRMLEVALEVGQRTPLDVVTTFLGAHVPERGTSRAEFVGLVVDEMLPECAPLASFCDVFCDAGAFTVEESRAVLSAGLDHGLVPRLHAEQLAHTGGSALAAELGASSADHLDHVTAADAALLRDSGVTAVLLPAASWSLQEPQAPARMLWDAGVTLALATDCNPGTSYLSSMPVAIAIACLEMGLTPDEAVWAATRGGALALRLADRGWIGPGAIGDIVLLDAPSHVHIPYRLGTDVVAGVVKRGRVIA